MRAPALLALLLLLVPAAAAEPRSVHVSFAGDGYVVAFTSPDPLSSPAVSWTDGAEGGTVVARESPHPGGDDDHAYAAEVPPRALDYTVGNRTFHLVAPPRPNGTVRVAFVADWGRSDESWAVLDRIVAERPDLVIVGGDISYANGRPGKWDEWLSRVEPLAARVPVMTAFGNHETLCADARQDLVVCDHEPVEYAEHFHMPGEGAAHDYAFDWGPVRFVALDTEAFHPRAESPLPDQTDAAAQERLLRSALSTADGRWKIVYYHRSLYSSNAGPDQPDAAARASFEPIFDALGVDLALSGHVHAYERTVPLRGVTFVDSGGGGRSLYAPWGPQPPWSAARAAEYEFLLLDVSPDRIDARAERTDGSALDAFTITTHHAAAATARAVPGAPALAAVAVAAAITRSRRCTCPCPRSSP